MLFKKWRRAIDLGLSKGMDPVPPTQQPVRKEGRGSFRNHLSFDLCQKDF